MVFLSLLVVVALGILRMCFVIVHMRENFVVERLGNFRIVLQPGFHFLVPVLDVVKYRHDIREQVLDIPPQTCITRDNIQVTVDGLVYMKVVNAHKASYGIADYRRASVNLAQTTMRSEVGKLTLDDAFKERERLNDAIVKSLDAASEPWGVKVMSYEIRNITPSAQVIHTLEKQMEAEREKRAEVILATASKQSKIMISEGIRQESINLSEGEKQKRVNLAKGKAQEIQIIAEATSKGLKAVASAINKPGGSEAVRMRLVEEFIARLNHVVEKAQVSVLPVGMAQLKSIMDEVRGLPMSPPVQSSPKKVQGA